MLIPATAAASAYGSGNLAVTVPVATQAGDLLYAIVVTDVTSGAAPALGAPAGWTTGFDNTVQNLGTAWMRSFWFVPGAAAAGTVYTFTSTLSALALVLLYRSDVGVRGSAPQAFEPNFQYTAAPITSPASQPTTTNPHSPAANLGFDVVAITWGANVNPPTISDVRFAGGGAWILDALLTRTPDSVNLAVYHSPLNTNLAVPIAVGAIAEIFGPSPFNPGGTAAWASGDLWISAAAGFAKLLIPFLPPAGASQAAVGGFPRRSEGMNPVAVHYDVPNVARRHFS